MQLGGLAEFSSNWMSFVENHCLNSENLLFPWHILFFQVGGRFQRLMSVKDLGTKWCPKYVSFRENYTIV